MPRKICDKMTPELPLAPIRAPCATAWTTAEARTRLDGGHFLQSRLHGQKHVGAGVAIWHREDVESIHRLVVLIKPCRRSMEQLSKVLPVEALYRRP